MMSPVTTTRLSSTSVYTKPEGPESSCTTQAFIRDYRIEKLACFGADKSSISAQCAAISSTDGGVLKVTPWFWNNAVRCTLPPPTMKIESVSGF